MLIQLAKMCLFPKGGRGARVPDGLLYRFLHFVPVTCVESLDVDVEIFPNLHEHVPFIAVRHKGDRNTDTTETSCTTDTVKVGLVIRLFLGRTGAVFFRNVL